MSRIQFAILLVVLCALAFYLHPADPATVTITPTAACNSVACLPVYQDPNAPIATPLPPAHGVWTGPMPDLSTY